MGFRVQTRTKTHNEKKFFLAVLGLRCCVGFSLAVENGDNSLVVVRGLLTVVASLVEHRL